MDLLFSPFSKYCVREKSMENFGNPKKKLRLDVSDLPDVITGNDDWWGQDDLTAEEFDMLENQATQSCNQENSVLNPAFLLSSKNNVCNGGKKLSEAESTTPLQYELEGRIKLLAHSLEKMSKELREERRHRDEIVAEKIKEFKLRESSMHKEIEKMQSVLQFKEQEMKSVCTKMHVLETQSAEKKVDQTSTVNQDSNTFLKRFNFGKDSSIQTENIHETSIDLTYRKHKLNLDMPQGKVKGPDAVSSLLCNRLVIPPVQNHFISALTPVPSELPLNNACQLSAGSVVRLNSQQETLELFEHFEYVLRNHLEYLQNLVSKTSVVSYIKSSPLSVRQKEITYKQHSVISCLKDLTYLLSCPWSYSIVQKYAFRLDDLSKQKTGPVHDSDLENRPSCSTTETVNTSEDFPELLKIILTLSSPDTYPSGYCKEGEIEWSLAALCAWSSSSNAIFLKFIQKLPIHSFICSHYNAACLSIAVKFLINICIDEGFKKVLYHKEGQCLVCSTASLLLRVVPTSAIEFSVPMIMIEDFLTTTFTIHEFPDSKMESSLCVSEMLQGIIISLWAFYEVNEKDEHIIAVLKKGFTLLYLLSGCISNFKGKRNLVEDRYISLVSGILTLSKENPEFKEFYDLIHVLWDFQEDMSEFDFDEPMEEAIPTVSDSDVLE